MGEITKTVLLNYYKEYEYINHEKYDDLILYYTQNNELDRRIAVILVSKTKELSLSTISLPETSNDESVLIMRKFIKFD